MNPSNTTAKKIIIVEDNTALAEIYKTRLELLGYTCFLAYNGITALYFIQQEIPDLVLLDLMVPDIAGDQILARMRGSTWGKDIPVFIISNLNEEDAPKGLRDLGISGYAVKMNLKDDDIDRIVGDILGSPATAAAGPVPAIAEVPVAPAPEPAPASVVPTMQMPTSSSVPPVPPSPVVSVSEAVEAAEPSGPSSPSQPA
ncbi:response regulator transcription factor [Candidatus Saccharibacteria bacterium]|nr:MAG: response regulator transcription factor [Candidatus Saccharibacteria bacterium]